MSFQDLGAIGEFVSSLFMLITLLYLATQVRYLKRQAKMQATFNRAQGARELMLGMANSDHLPQIMKKAREKAQIEPSPLIKHLSEEFDLETDEAQRLMNWYFAWMKSQEAHYGNLEPQEQESTDQLILGFQTAPGYDFFWSSSKHNFNKDFVLHVDSLFSGDA